MHSLEHPDKFVNRHIGPDDKSIVAMLETIGADSIETLIDETIPKSIRLEKPLSLDKPLTEYWFIEKLKKIAAGNKVFKSYIGLGYYNTTMPAVIQRNILENPGWYTQYTPYQAEIAQGRLEALMNFQTMVIDLTGMPIANASLLDEGTAAAEAMFMFYNLRKNKNADRFFVSKDVFPQTLELLNTRANPHNIKIVTGDWQSVNLEDSYFGVLVQYPSGLGEVYDYKNFFNQANELGIFKVVAADILSLALLTAPGEFGADCVVGSTQRFGIPMGYGGPHAAYFATKEEFKRVLPGRIIGLSVDVHGNNAYRMALQTREQHIRREKATSNICTAQVLLAVMAGMYAVYHGPEGIKAIATRIHLLTRLLENELKKVGYELENRNSFDTLKINLTGSRKALQSKIRSLAESRFMNFRYIGDDSIGISLNEPTDINNIIEIIRVFSEAVDAKFNEEEIRNFTEELNVEYPANFARTTKYLQHPVFNSFHSETEMMRYLKRLENKDLSLVHSMIPLGSCTMKLNATTEMIGITWPEFAKLHPFAPKEQTLGYQEIFRELEKDLCEITGFSGVSLQPNSGAQGEYTGLMVIREYFKSRNEGHRDVCLIPSSAHGTNPASSVMAGYKVVVVESDKQGYISLEDLNKKAVQYKDSLAALMITYPSTHGVFEEDVIKICKIVHDNGGQVYMDGANMNAQVGLTSPASIGADVCHLNLHKTFSIPHGGGGPGMGPIAAASHLVPFLPNHPVINLGHKDGITAVSSAPWGSADVLIISYAYIKMMGAEGLRKASEIAILNANYIKAKLEKYFPVLFSGGNDRVAHELIFDMRNFKHTANIEVEDIAKRLMDYGYHAPTVSFPVPGTLMVEPTESESRAELDRFCSALISIKEEITNIENGNADRTDNVLKNAPHTMQSVLSDNWKHPYSREKAAFPTPWTKVHKFWPSVGRINNAYGDRNLICSCNPISSYVEEPVL